MFLLLLASPGWACEPPMSLVYGFGPLDGATLPTDGSIPIGGSGIARLDVVDADGDEVTGTIERFAYDNAGMQRWVPDVPLSPGTYHAALWDLGRVTGDLLLAEADFDVDGSSEPPPAATASVAPGPWHNTYDGCNMIPHPGRDVTLDVAVPDGGAWLLVEALGTGDTLATLRVEGSRQIDFTEKDDGVPIEACYRLRTVGWSPEIVERMVCAEGGEPTGCSHAPQVRPGLLAALLRRR